MLKNATDLTKLAKGISFSWIRFALTIIIGIVQTPLLFQNLIKEELNFWYIFFLFGAFLQMADLGLVQTLSRLIAYIDNAANKNIEDNIVAKLSLFSIRQIYNTALFSFTAILVAVGVIIIGIYTSTYKEIANTDTLKLAFIVYVIGIIFNLLSNVPAAMLIGYRDISAESIVRSIFQISYFSILFLLLPVYKSILLVSIAFLVQNLGQLIVLHMVLYLRHKSAFTEKHTLRQLFQPTVAKQIYRQSFPLVINQFGGWMISQGSVLMASIVVGSSEISDYAINQQLFTYVTSVALVINQAVGPFIAKRYIQSKFEGLQTMFGNTLVACLSIACIMLLVLMTCSGNVITLWVGSTHFLGTSFAIVFGLITFLEVQHSVAGNFVWNTGSWPFNKWTLLAGVLTVVLGYGLGKIHGLLGIALATLLSKLLTLNWYVVYFSLAQLGVSVREYVFRLLAPLLISLCVAMIVAVLVKYQSTILWDNNNLLITITVGIVAGTVFVFLIGIFFNRYIRTFYTKIMSSQIKT